MEMRKGCGSGRGNRTTWSRLGGALLLVAWVLLRAPAFSELVPGAMVYTLAGNGGSGLVDGPGAKAQFHWPVGLVADAAGSLYVADFENHCIRHVSPEGVVRVLAGNGTAGFADGAGTEARFSGPNGICLGENGSLYVADAANRRIRKIDRQGRVSTVAGSGDPGHADGPALQARFRYPTGVVADGQGNLYVTDRGNHRIRKLGANGWVSTLAGSGHPGFRDGLGTEAEFHDPLHLARDENGVLYVTDGASRSIRKITPAGEVTTLTGGPFPSDYDRRKGYPHQLLWPTGIAVRGPDEIYVADGQGHCVYRVSSQGRMWLLAGIGEVGRMDGSGLEARFNFPTGLALDPQGTLFLSDAGNHCVRKLRLGRLT